MTAHAPLAPSSAAQWGNCSGSVMAQFQVPDAEHPRTRAGTASHWVASEALLSYRDSEHGIARCDRFIGKTAPNGVVIDEEMAEGAQVYVDYCIDLACHYDVTPETMLIEHRVSMPQIHAHNWGTLDFALIHYDAEWVDHGTINARRRNIVSIWLCDYKFGHRNVKAVGNLQLVNYCAGLINELNIDGFEDQHIRVHFAVVQPFAFHGDGPVSTWTGTLSDLRADFNRLTAKAHEAFAAPSCTSGAWCRDCKAIIRCDTAKRSAYSVTDYVNEPVALETYTAEQLGTEYGILLAASKTLKARLEAIEEDLTHRIGKGEAGSGFSVQSSKGRLAWTCDPAAAVAICSQFGVDAAKPGVLTPTQVKSKIPADKRESFEQVFKQITETPMRGMKLVPSKDSRTAHAFKRKMNNAND